MKIRKSKNFPNFGGMNPSDDSIVRDIARVLNFIKRVAFI